MDLLEDPLPTLLLQPDKAPSEFFDRCEDLARKRGYGIDRRPSYAGPGYDHLNLHLGGGQAPPMVRMVTTPREPSRISLDVVTKWVKYPIDYDEYLGVARQAYAQLLKDYATDYGPRLRVGISRRRPRLDMQTVDCGRVEYAQEKFSLAIRSLAVGPGDVRDRLRAAWSIIHVISPADLPVPLRQHLEWVFEQLTRRDARHSHEGALDATLDQMRRGTGAKVAERILALAEALEDLHKRCRKKPTP